MEDEEDEEKSEYSLLLPVIFSPFCVIGCFMGLDTS